jgi:VanZ family protein
MLWLPPAAYMLLVFYLSSQSRPMPIVTEHVWDKLLHFAEYAALGALLFRALRGEELSWALAFVAAAVVTAAYGATDEWHQSFVPLRDASVRDWLTDLLGGAAGAGLYGTWITDDVEHRARGESQ